MNCPTPPLEILNEDGSLSINSPKVRRKREISYENNKSFKRYLQSDLHVFLHRSRRQATSKNITSVRINNGTIEIQIGLILDGVEGYRNLTETLPQYSKLNVYTNPKVRTWKDKRVVTFGKKLLEVEVTQCLNICMRHEFLLVCFKVTLIV